MAGARRGRQLLKASHPFDEAVEQVRYHAEEDQRAAEQEPEHQLAGMDHGISIYRIYRVPLT